MVAQRHGVLLGEHGGGAGRDERLVDARIVVEVKPTTRTSGRVR